jgi:hypothetical protein
MIQLWLINRNLQVSTHLFDVAARIPRKRGFTACSDRPIGVFKGSLCRCSRGVRQNRGTASIRSHGGKLPRSFERWRGERWRLHCRLLGFSIASFNQLYLVIDYFIFSANHISRLKVPQIQLHSI